MTPEIKQRIEQIKNGEIPEGYKRTKAGIIPEKWEIKKLSDVLKKQTQKNTDNEIQNVLTNSATQGIVCQTEYFDKQIANNENTSGYYIVKPGYFVYNPRISVSAPCGPFNRYNGDKDGIMSPLYSVYCFCDKSINYANFLTYYFSSSKWYAYMNSIANYGARSDRMNVTGEDMNNMPIPYPPLPEQQKIVAILSAQDTVIKCYEKKIEQLKRIKKYYLQNMFPKHGESVPKIRFKGFTNPWEQRKFRDMYKRRMERNNGQFDNTRWISVAKMYFQEPEKVASNNIDTRTYVMREGDIAFEGHTNNEFKYGRFVTNDIGDGVISELFPIYQHIDVYDLKYWKYAIQLESIMQSRLVRCIEISYTSSNKLEEKSFLKESILVPSIEEQKVIGIFFTSIDNLITLHQRKLEEEKKKKKALRQLLLTGIVRTN